MFIYVIIIRQLKFERQKCHKKSEGNKYIRVYQLLVETSKFINAGCSQYAAAFNSYI